MYNFIGQEINRHNIDTMLEENSLPRFIVIRGKEHSGRAFMAGYISYRLGAVKIFAESGVDGVRQCISNAYKTPVPVCYIFRDADNLSLAALNSMLKIVEEPPKQAYFILTMTEGSFLIPTLISRCLMVDMEPYTTSQLWRFNKDELILKYADSPGTCKILESIDLADLVSFCNSILDNVAEVTTCNALKIVNRLKLKDSDDGFEPDIFLQVFGITALDRITALNSDLDKVYARCVIISYKYLSQIKKKSIKKSSTMDMFILELKKCLQEETYE